MRFNIEKTINNILKLSASILVLFLVLGYTACERSVDYEENIAPGRPYYPYPADGAIYQDTSLQLSWLCSDPDGDSLYYDLYLGTGSELSASLAAADLAQSFYNPGELLDDTTYYWQVIARDNEEHISAGPVWHFSTGVPDWQISPPDGATVTEIPEVLTWACNVLEGDSLTYNLYLGFDPDSPLLLSGVFANSHNPNWLALYRAEQKLYEIYAAEKDYRWTSHTYWDGGYASAAAPNEFFRIDIEIPVSDIYTYCIKTAYAVNLKVDAICGSFDDDYETRDIREINQYGELICISDDFELAFSDNCTYYWQVKATNQNGDTATSPIFSFSTDVNLPPSQPQNPLPTLHASDSTMETILSWDCSDPDNDFILYDVYFGFTPNPPLAKANYHSSNYDPGWGKQKESWIMLQQIYAGEQKYFDENDCYWGNAGPGSACRPDAFNAIDVQIPTSAKYTYTIIEASSTDLLVSATCGLLDDDAAVDKWTIDENGKITSVGNDFDTPAFYLDTTYYWKIVAKDNYGGETEGPVWSFNTKYNFDTLYPPCNPIPADNASDQKLGLNLYWEMPVIDVGCAVIYDLYLGLEPDPPLHASGIPSTMYYPGLLERDRQYFWKIIARSEGGLSTESPVWSFRTTDSQPPELPSNPYPQDGAVEIEPAVNLSWECNDPDDSALVYELYFGTDAIPALLIDRYSSRSFSKHGLKDNTTYYWRIVARDTGGNRTVGPVWSFTTVYNLPPTVPSNPIPADGSGDITIMTSMDWNCSDPDDDTIIYDFYFGTAPNPTRVATDLDTTNMMTGWEAHLEVKDILTQIWTAEQQYFQEHGEFWGIDIDFSSENPNALEEYGIILPDSALYHYSIFSAQTGFLVNASANLDDDDGMDRWEIGVFTNNLRCTSYDLLPPVEPNTTYYWKIVAADHRGNYSIGPVWSFTTAPE